MSRVATVMAQEAAGAAAAALASDVSVVAAQPIADVKEFEAVQRAATLAQGGDTDAALAVLRGELAEAPAEALSTGYGAVIEAYVAQDRTDDALNLLTQLLQKSGASSVTMAAQETLLQVVVQAQQYSKTVELLRVACGAGAAPSDAVFNSAVDAAVRARAYSEAWDILELLLASRRRADKYFVSILTKSLESFNDRRCVRRGIALVDRFIGQQKEDVDEIVFNSLLNVLGQVGDMPKLQATLDKMHEYGVSPSAVTYGTVVKAYGRSRDIDSVLKVWQEMRNRCLGVNPVTCGCVLDACVKCGHLSTAMTIFQEMRCQGLHKNTVLYATLIKGLAKVRDLASAVQLYHEMRVENVPCNLVTFNSLMDVCVRCGDLSTAAYFLQDMMSMGIEPDLITFSTLIKGYSHTGEVQKAMALKNELKQRGLKCDEIMYNSLIDGCAKAGKIQDGLYVFQDMLQSYVDPSNITFSILVKLHFEAGQVAEAFQLVEDMAGRYRCPPTRIVYTVLFRCCAQHAGAALARGCDLLRELANRKGGKLVDQAMVSAMIFGCLRFGELDMAVSIVRDVAAGNGRRGGAYAGGHAGASAASCNVPPDCLRTVAQALGHADESRGRELVEYLRKKGMTGAHVHQLTAAIEEGVQCRSTGRQPQAVAGEGHSAKYYDEYSRWQIWQSQQPPISSPTAAATATAYPPAYGVAQWQPYGVGMEQYQRQPQYQQQQPYMQVHGHLQAQHPFMGHLQAQHPSMAGYYSAQPAGLQLPYPGTSASLAPGIADPITQQILANAQLNATVAAIAAASSSAAAAAMAPPFAPPLQLPASPASVLPPGMDMVSAVLSMPSSPIAGQLSAIPASPTGPLSYSPPVVATPLSPTSPAPPAPPASWQQQEYMSPIDALKLSVKDTNINYSPEQKGTNNRRRAPKDSETRKPYNAKENGVSVGRYIAKENSEFEAQQQTTARRNRGGRAPGIHAM